MSLSEEEDSDATVLEEDSQPAISPSPLESQAVPSSQEVTEELLSGATALSPPSPSILHSSLRYLIQQRGTRNTTDNYIIEKHKAEHQSDDDDIMSQEFPPLSVTAIPSAAPLLLLVDSQSHNNQREEQHSSFLHRNNTTDNIIEEHKTENQSSDDNLSPPSLSTTVAVPPPLVDSQSHNNQREEQHSSFLHRNNTTDNIIEEHKTENQSSDDDLSQPSLSTIVDSQSHDNQREEHSNTSSNSNLTSVPITTQPLRATQPATPTSPPPLEEISRQQTALMQVLEQLTPSAVTGRLLVQVKAKAVRFEASLESVGTANQSERRRLAGAHSTISQRVNSQAEFVSESQSLQRQLLDLTKKQKHLLECVSRQKELRAQLARFAPQLKTTSQTSTVQVATVSELTQNVLSSMASLKVSSNTLLSQPASVLAQQVPPEVTAKTSFALQSEAPQKPVAKTSFALQSEALQKPVAVESSTIASSKAPSSSDLSEPVPLNTLIKHGFFQPGPNTLSCLILGCQFKASLLSDGTIEGGVARGQSGAAARRHPVYHQPQQWVKACWTQLGHPHKKISRKLAYTTVLYKKLPLLSYCEKYSIKQVSSYLSQRSPDSASGKVDSLPSTPSEHSETTITTVSSETTSSEVHGNVLQSAVDTTLPKTVRQPSLSATFNVSQLLRDCSVLLVSPVVKGCSTSLTLPPGFWGSSDIPLTRQLVTQIQLDLDW